MKESNEENLEKLLKGFEIITNPNDIKEFEKIFNEYSWKRRGEILTYFINIEQLLKEIIVSFYHIRREKREKFIDDFLKDMNMINLISLLELNIKQKYKNNIKLSETYKGFINILKNLNVIRNCYAHYNPEIDIDFDKSTLIIDPKIEYKRRKNIYDLDKAYTYFLKYNHMIYTFITALNHNMSILTFVGYDKYSYDELIERLKQINLEFEEIKS